MRGMTFLLREILHSPFQHRLRMAAFTTYKCFYRQPASRSRALISTIPALLLPMSATFLLIASITTGAGPHGTLIAQLKRTITGQLQRRSNPRTRSSPLISVLRAAGTLQRPGPTSKGEGGSSAEMVFHTRAR